MATSMKSRIARIILGALCVLLAFWPGSLAVSLYVHVIQPNRATGPSATTFVMLDMGGWKFAGNEINLLAGIAGLGAAALFLGGLFLVFFWPRDDHS